MSLANKVTVSLSYAMMCDEYLKRETSSVARLLLTSDDRDEKFHVTSFFLCLNSIIYKKLILNCFAVNIFLN
jgi:hypothetical protein